MGAMKNLFIKIQESQRAPDENTESHLWVEGLSVSIPSQAQREEREMALASLEFDLRLVVSRLLHIGVEPERILYDVTKQMAKLDPTFALRFMIKKGDEG